jgi:ferric-dicitrate binding protein FerR (iron transport regulator)
MDDLILRSLEGALSPAESRSLEQWRAERPEHERHYVEMVRLAELLAARTSRSIPPPASRIIALSDGRRGPRAGRLARLAWVGAALAAAALLVTVGNRAGNSRKGVIQASPLGEVVTGPGEASTILLADGSVVRLAPESRISIRDLTTKREVEFEGTAFFAIAKQPGLPFVVRTSAGTATVLGTRFELRTAAREMRVLVVEGKVAVRDAGNELRLGAGEMTFVGSGARPTISKVTVPGAQVAWLGKVMLFQDTPLTQVAQEIEDRYGLPVVIADSALAGHLVSGTFPGQPIERVTAVVCEIVNADCTIGSGAVTIRAKD